MTRKIYVKKTTDLIGFNYIIIQTYFLGTLLLHHLLSSGTILIQFRHKYSPHGSREFLTCLPWGEYINFGGLYLEVYYGLAVIVMTSTNDVPTSSKRSDTVSPALISLNCSITTSLVLSAS